jgi:hypothetical protein
VTLTVTDDDGGVGQSIFQFVVVYDPNGGFVTGGGTIDSPAGAYVPDEDLTGQANFGFVSKYKKGQSTPDGNTQFQFQVADLNFHSTSYDWLVVAGHQALYKGDGTINGAGNYGFLVSVVDENLTVSTDEDKFRIKIVDKDDGDTVVYDNQLGDDEDLEATTAIASGQIVIHKAKGKKLVLDDNNRIDVSAGSAAVSSSSHSTSRSAPRQADPNVQGPVVVLSHAMLDSAVTQAIAYWADQGTDADRLDALRQSNVHVANLNDDVLGLASPSHDLVWIDRDAAGHGWAPLSDSAETILTHGVDLLSTITHEFGHLLDLDHDVMGSTVGVGMRRLAASHVRTLDQVHASLESPSNSLRRLDHQFEWLAKTGDVDEYRGFSDRSLAVLDQLTKRSYMSHQKPGESQESSSFDRGSDSDDWMSNASMFEELAAIRKRG